MVYQLCTLHVASGFLLTRRGADVWGQDVTSLHCYYILQLV